MVAPSSASRWPGESWITVSSATAVSRLATTAAPTPRLMSRRRSDAPILTRKVISAPTTRIASSPSRSMMMNDWTKRLAGETASLNVRSALSSPTASRSRTRASSLGCRARGLGPERRELGLEVGGERGILGPNLALDLLEGHVGVERLRSGAGVAASREGVGGFDLRPHLVEHRAGGSVGPVVAVRTAARRPSAAAELSCGVPRAARSCASDIRPLTPNERSESGTVPAAAGRRSVEAYRATAQRSSAGSRASKAGMAVPTTPMLTRR